jgi:hypothetical protein
MIFPCETSLVHAASVADPDPDLFGHIRILALIYDPVSTFLVSAKAINTSGTSVV